MEGDRTRRGGFRQGSATSLTGPGVSGRGDEETRTRTLTMSAMSGSSGLGSAMSSWMEASTVAMLRDGRQAPCAQRGGGFVTRSSGRRRRPPRSHKPRSLPSRSTHLGRQLEDIQADPPGRVDVGVIDGSQKPDLGRLKWVPWKAADNGDSLLRCCLSAHRKQLPGDPWGRQPSRGKPVPPHYIFMMEIYKRQKGEMTASRHAYTHHLDQPASSSKSFTHSHG